MGVDGTGVRLFLFFVVYFCVVVAFVYACLLFCLVCVRFVICYVSVCAFFLCWVFFSDPRPGDPHSKISDL